MIEAKLDRSKKLVFNLDIQGNVTQIPKSRFIIHLTSTLSLAINGVISEGKVTIEVPPLYNLKEVFSDLTTECYLEVTVGDNYFIPWESQLKLIEKVKVVIEPESFDDLESMHEVPKVSVTSLTDSIEEDGGQIYENKFNRRTTLKGNFTDEFKNSFVDNSKPSRDPFKIGK